MGLVGKDQVPPLTLIDSPGIDRNRLPEVGVTIAGMARSISMDQIIAAMGERFPAADPEKTLRMAFILLVNPGTWSDTDPASQYKLQLINNLQAEWQKRFTVLTRGAALVQTSLETDDASAANPGLNDDSFISHLNPHVNEGVNWLLTHQETDGQWQDQFASAQRDTAAAVAALKSFALGSVSAARGQVWLSQITADNHDFLARKILQLDTTDLSDIVQMQNTDGGWGSAPGYQSNPADSALVLRALAAQGLTDSSVIDAAITYLQNAQGVDGGWSHGHGISMVQPTASVLLALEVYREDPRYLLQSTFNQGLVWLAGKQNLDGGFGDSLSTVYDSAMALMAFKVAGTAQLVIDNTVNYLLNCQSNTGSWGNSVFQTAMAVQALYHATVQTDLQIEDSDLGIDAFADHQHTLRRHCFGADLEPG